MTSVFGETKKGADVERVNVSVDTGTPLGYRTGGTGSHGCAPLGVAVLQAHDRTQKTYPYRLTNERTQAHHPAPEQMRGENELTKRISQRETKKVRLFCVDNRIFFKTHGGQCRHPKMCFHCTKKERKICVNFVQKKPGR